MAKAYRLETSAPFSLLEGRFNPKINLRRLGPIEEGEIELRPLTLLIGPNNAGKSYAAMIVHALLQSIGPTQRSATERRGPRLLNLDAAWDTRSIESSLPSLGKKLADLGSGDSFELSSQMITSICGAIFDEVYARRFSEELERAFDRQLSEIIKFGRRRAGIHIHGLNHTAELRLLRNKIEVGGYSLVNPTVKIEVRRDPEPLIEIAKSEGSIDVAIGGFEPGGTLDEHDIDILQHFIIHSIGSYLFQDFPDSGYYLPAGRTGLIQVKDVVIPKLIKESPADSRRLQIPGPVRDFLSILAGPPEGDGPFADVTSSFEDEMIGGKIVLEGEGLDAKILYDDGDNKIRLGQTSSGITELSPVFLFLRRVVGLGDSLIVEEPEAHLHPKNEMAFARLLARCVNRGLGVLATTHSDYLVEQLSNQIRIGVLMKEKNENIPIGYAREEGLSASQVGVFLFRPQADGVEIHQIQTTEKDGIRDEEFSKIAMALYEESVEIERAFVD